MRPGLQGENMSATTVIINLTPHEVHEVNSNRIWPKSQNPARVDSKTESAGKINGIETFYTELLPTDNLPEPRMDTYYIVSALVLGNNPDRTDLLAPGVPVRDSEGRVIGTSGFRRNKPTL